jgi:hypothetical protein
MISTLSIVRAAIAARKGLWVLVTLGFVTAYYGGLLLSVIIRFGELPNYAKLYDYLHNILTIIRSTPSVLDMLPIISNEWLLEVGYMNRDYGHGIAEWSIEIIPPKLVIVLAVGALVATNVVLLSRFRPACARSLRYSGVAATGLGAALVGFTSVTMMWVVCCAAPSWAVGLALLGVGLSTAFGVQPFGTSITLAGFAVLLAATFVLARGGLLATEDAAAMPHLAPHSA